MNEDLMQKIMGEVMKKMADAPEVQKQEVQEEKCESKEEAKAPCTANFTGCGLTEFVGTAIGSTIGLVIANLDAGIHEALTAPTSPLTITVTNPEPIFSYPTKKTFADLTIASAASIAPTNPLVSIIPRASLCISSNLPPISYKIRYYLELINLLLFNFIFIYLIKSVSQLI